MLVATVERLGPDSPDREGAPRALGATSPRWLRGSNLVEIHRSISRGNAAAGMPAWAEIYAASELQALATYVASLSAGKPVPGKPPEGRPAPMEYTAAKPAARRR